MLTSPFELLHCIQTDNLCRTGFPSSTSDKHQQAPTFPSPSASASPAAAATAAAGSGQAVTDTWSTWRGRVERTVRTSTSPAHQPGRRRYGTRWQRHGGSKTVVLPGRVPGRQQCQASLTHHSQQHGPIQPTGTATTTLPVNCHIALSKRFPDHKSYLLYVLSSRRKPFVLRLRITNLKNVLHITVLFSVTITAVELFVWRREEHKTHSRGFTGVIQWRN